MTDQAHTGEETPTRPPRRTRDGFALPLAILVIAFLTITIAAAYAATSSEVTTNTAQRGESRASMIAQAGLENFMARRNEMTGNTPFCANCGLPPAVTYESTTVSLPGGYAQVVAQRVRVADNNNKRPAIYLLRSKGFDTANYTFGVSATGARVKSYAERTVGQLVFWNVNQVNVLSGWTATNGLNKMGSSGTISGVDACPGNQGGGKPTVAGIAVPEGDYGVNGNFTPQGDPPVSYIEADEMAETVKIDWDGVINGNRIQPDLTFANGAAATAGWPVSGFTNTNWWPVIRVNGDFTLPTTGGRGTLIVMGNLTMSGNNLWNGILLVGGQMTSNGNGTVQGATMSGLNTLLTPTQLAKANTLSSSTLVSNPPNATANGTKTFQYNSCDVARAAGGLASYSVYPNAWMDNLVTY